MVENWLSVVMTSPSLSSSLDTRSMAECLCVGSMGGRELAVILALVLSVTGHLRGRHSSKCWLRRSPLLPQRVARTRHRWFQIAQLSCSFEYFVKNISRTSAVSSTNSHLDSSQIAHTSNVLANCCTWPVTHRPVRVFFRKIWRYLVG